jgi:hypothetical protein
MDTMLLIALAIILAANRLRSHGHRLFGRATNVIPVSGS